MYGNFDAIKSRKKLRDETTTSRKDRVNSHKNSIFRGKKENVFPEISAQKVNDEIKIIQTKFEKERKKKTIKNVSFFIVIFSIILYIIIKYIYPFLF